MPERRNNPEPAKERLARHLRSLRAHRGLSQEALADLAGMHRTYVGSVERSERNVSVEQIEKLSIALGVDISELFAPG